MNESEQVRRGRGTRRLGVAGLATAIALVAAAPVAAKGPDTPTLLKGPYLTRLTNSAAEVRVELDRAAPATLEVRREGADAQAPARGESVASVTASAASSPADLQVLRVSGLQAATTYVYSVRSGPKVVAGGHFTTAPEPDSRAPFTFLVYGDDRSNPTAHQAVVRAMLAAPADFLVNTGDLVADGGRAADWQSFFDIEAPLLRDHPFFVAIGNHELFDDRAGGHFERYFGSAAPGQAEPVPYWTMRWSDARFFFLNTMHDWSGGPDRIWLEDELRKADHEDGLVWRFAVMHHGPWSSGPHGGSAMLAAQHVPELLAAHGVDLLFAGHDHLYERGDHDGMKYVVSGGAGAPLYPIARQVPSARKDEAAFHFVQVSVSESAVSLVARRVDGSVLDRCGFGPKKSWDCDPPPPPSAPAAPPVAPPPASPPSPGKSTCACRAPGDGSSHEAQILGGAMFLAGVLVRRRRRADRHRGESSREAIDA